MKMDLALNNWQWLIGLKTKPNQTKTHYDYVTLISFFSFSFLLCKLWGIEERLLFICRVGRRCRWIIGFCLDDFELCIWLLFLLTPWTCHGLLSVGSCKRIKGRDKDTFILELYFEVQRLFCGVKYFPEAAKIVASLRQDIEIY